MKSTAGQYGIAAVSLVTALLGRFVLDPVCGDHMPFITLYVALAVVAWFGGLKPTLVVVVLGGLAATYWFIPPRESLGIALPMHRFQLISYLVAGVVIGVFGETCRQARLALEARAEELRKNQAELAAEITVRKRLEEELKERNEELTRANRNKDRFMAFLGHELRNPLTAIHATLEALNDEPTGEARLEKHFELMARQAHSLSRMVEDLLDVSRITRGTVELRARRLDALQAVRNAVESVRPIAESRHHELIVLPQPPELWIEADPVRLEQILSNLLHNAAKYTDPGGRIWISTERAGLQAILRVRDTGRGIAAPDLARIFQPFVQLDPSADRRDGGMGLGLALVKKLVEMHGGSVSAFSVGLGKGSEFTVRLPLRQARAPEMASGRTLPNRRRILLVDDHADIAAAMAAGLQRFGYEVHVASGGEEALEMAQEFLPDAILLDIGLPGIDGYEVARRLRREPRFKGTLLVAVSGYGIDGEDEKARHAGFDRQLIKPVSSAEVEQILASELA